jgi:hypothetical protein
LLTRPDYFTLDQLLTRRLFRIPHYQRAYSWHSKQRADMFNDIENLRGKPKGFHFMATVIGLHRDTKTIVADEYSVIEVVDGQQRLTTLVLLLKVIERKLNRLKPTEKILAEEFQKLLVKQDDLSLILLQTNHDQSQYFSNFLISGTHPNDKKKAQTLADRELLTAIQECESFVDKWNDRIELSKIVKNQLKFIFHEINDESAVYTVFEVLNNRGLHVSWLDRLKSRLMSVAFEDNQGNSAEHIEELHRIWGNIYEAIGLRQGLSTEALRFGATLKSPSRISKPLGEEDAVESLTKQVDTNAFKAREVSNWLLEVTKAVDKFLGDMKHSRDAVTAISHARLLAVAIILRAFPSNQETEFLNQWEKITFRVFGLCRKDARTGVGDYVRLAWDIRNKQELNTDEILNRITKLGASHSIDEALSQPESQNWYEGWEEELRYLLFRYEEHLAEQQGRNFDNEQWNHIWKDSASRSIEHILPQSKGSQEPHQAGQESIYVHRLGNLILLPPGLNSKLGDKDPREKAKSYLATGLLSAVEVAQTIQQSGWGAKQVAEREQRLIKWIRDIWK